MNVGSNASKMEKNKSSVILWSIHHKGVIYLIVGVLMAVGIYGIWHMDKDEFPSFEIKQGLVAAVYPGASSEEIEDQVAKPVEQALLSFKEVERSNLNITSKDGICYIIVDLTVPAKMKDEVWSKIKLKLNEVKNTLPPGVLALVVVDEFSQVSSSLIAMESSDKGYAELKDLADELRDRLGKIPDMGAVTIYGDQSEEIAVTVDYDKLSQYGISPASLMLDYQTSSLSLPSGNFDTDFANSPVHVHSTIGSEWEVAERIVYSDPAGGIVRLKDIATIERRYKDPDSFVNYNGHAALIISVEMKPDNDIVAFGKELDEVLNDFSSDMPESVTLSRITDQPKLVENSVFSFLRDLVISMIVVIFVMLMLFPVRSALIAGSGVPVCTAIAIAIMYLTGIGLNTVTLAALIVCLGMIVDDSIITIDGYMSARQKGYSPEEAAKQSAKELVMPMLTATSAISLMFFPIKGIITGYLGDFVSNFPWVVAFALMTSLVYAIFVVPGMEVSFIKSTAPQKESVVTRIQNKFFAFIQRIYNKAQDWCFRKPKLTLLLAVCTVGLGVFLFTQVNVQMMPMADRDFFAVEVSLDSDADLNETMEVIEVLQEEFLKDSRIESVTSFVGNSAPRFTATYAPTTPAPNYAQLIVNTVSMEATREILPEYEEKYEHMFPNALVRIKQMDYQASNPVEIHVQGADIETLRSVSDSIKTFMYGMTDQLKWIHSTYDDCISCMEVRLNPEESARLGVNKSMLSLSLYGLLNGQTLSSIWEGDKSVPVNLYCAGLDGETIDYDFLGNSMVSTSIPGVSVPLRQVAGIEPDWQPSRRIRYAGEETVILYADMKTNKSQPEAIKEIRSFVDSMHLPEGVHVEYRGLSKMNTTVIPEIMLSFVCCVGILFLFLLIHFRKVSIALLTIAVSLLCIFGAFFGLWLFGLDFGITAVLGLVSLVGIIVRNGIVLFEYAEELRYEQNMPVKEAASEAGKRRMRPIFLTSCTTALGVLPMIISGDALWLPMGVVICFGTMLTIALITLVMPVAYWQILGDKKKKEAKQ